MAKLPLDVQQAIEKQAPRALRLDFDKQFKQKFEALKREMIAEFMAHPVTVELQNPDGPNVSGTLGGVNNLFGFIGFEKGYNPIAPILQLLEKIDYNISNEIKIGWKFNINFPTAKDIFLITPMPWATGRSWAKGIESGISGLGFLLSQSSSYSRSGVAIQASKKVRSAKFNNTAYISELINKYTTKFNKLQ